MTLDEAIRYALEVAETNDCEECRAEHLQLAEWLQELRAIRQEVKKLRETLHFLKAYEEKLKREARAEKERLRRVLEEAREEIQNCYGRDISLTERIWQALEGSQKP